MTSLSRTIQTSSSRDFRGHVLAHRGQFRGQVRASVYGHEPHDRCSDGAGEARVPFAQLLELARFAGQHPAVRFLPAIERLLGNAELAADVADGRAGFGFFEDRCDLLDRITFFFTARLLANGPDCAAELTSQVD